MAKLISEQLEYPIYIKGDDVLNMIVNSGINLEHVLLTERNLVSLVRNFAQSGYKNYIIDFVYEEQYCLKRFVTELKSAFVMFSSLDCFVIYRRILEEIVNVVLKIFVAKKE